MHTMSTAFGVLLTLAHLGAATPARQSQNGPINFNLASEQAPLNVQSGHPTFYSSINHNTKRQNFDNTCGVQHGKKVKCNVERGGAGPCCSSFGFCGFGPFYCGDGCQSKFGKCDELVSLTRETKCGPKHKNKKCSTGDCCSANGKCGRSESYCGKHCQSRFRECDRDASPTASPKPEPALKKEPGPTRKAQKIAQAGEQCGPASGNATCTEGFCCSGSGYCGQGSQFCAVPQNCQPDFGICDSDDVPKGFDLSPRAQPRRRVGKVPYGQVITRCTKPKTIALTFDDGPSNNTDDILDVLRSYGANATFFLSGNTGGRGMIDVTERWIEVIKRMIVDGHQIGSHSWSHPRLSRTSRDNQITDMIRNDRAITNIIGKFPTYMRPPYAECSNTSNCLLDMAELGYHVVGYEVDSHDWQRNFTLEQMKSNILNVLDGKKLDDNMFLVQHDQSQYAVELTKFVLEETKKKQWQAVTLGDCLDDPEEFWYNDPVWIDPNTIARSNGANGCVVSGPGFCGLIQSFDNKEQCDTSVGLCMELTAICQMTVAKYYPSCEKYHEVCVRQVEFCETCDRKGTPGCKMSNWTFNRYGH